MKGDMSRSHAREIAVLASGGRITAALPATNVGSTWVVTEAGIGYYFWLKAREAA